MYIGLTLGLTGSASSAAVLAQAPSLDLNFLSGTLDPRITFTRASPATRFNASGVLETVATNEPRFDYDPATLTARGLLIEEARTNSIRNNSMAGAAAGVLPTSWGVGSLAGITTSVVGSGTENGLPYLDIRYAGTATGTLEVSIDATGTTVAAEGQAWTSSVYVKLAGGSLTNVTSVQTRTYQHGSTNQTPGNITPTSAALRTQRVQSTRTLTTGATSTQCRLSTTFAGAVDVTLRFGAPQLEQGSFATSPILTLGSAAVTRAADVATAPVANGTYDVLVQDKNGAEWRNGIVVASSSYPLVPRSSQRYISRVRVYRAGAIGAAIKTTMQVSA